MVAPPPPPTLKCRAGRTVVREVDHTVLIGWNDKCLMFIRQFAIARAPKGGVVVVLVAGPKEAIENNFNTMITRVDLRGTKVVFRSGEPQSIASLKQVGSLARRRWHGASEFRRCCGLMETCARSVAGFRCLCSLSFPCRAK